ncbi:Flp pilus assembly protein CpaB [Oryzifoliimicrobium ureilyticus]|uniref:Flp pilus assembly protein CpaB n=1 Tax=Oryzifoliimicrobium ureilyticus TaxID=3113724 RepID=UPI00307618D1
MKPARLVIMGVAVVAAGLAGFIAMNLAGRQNVVTQVQSVIEREPSVNVLVVSANMPVGARINEKSVRWMPWPKSGVVAGLVTESEKPNAIRDLQGAVVRLPLFEGEPLRPEKVADSSSRVMSSLLPAGKRAVATDITAVTGAGGFILPNDRVDVLMVRKPEADGKYRSETVLTNVRVLAIDQQIQEKEDGSKTVLGTTATLELTPDQAKALTVAQQLAVRISLALRSVADSQEKDTVAPEDLLTGPDSSSMVQVIKSGKIAPDGFTPPKSE